MMGLDLGHSRHQRPGPRTIRATPACRNSGRASPRSGTRRPGARPIATRAPSPSAPTSRRSRGATTSGSATAWTTCTSTTGSPSAPTLADGSTFAGNCHADVRHGVADRELLQHVRGVPARPRQHREQELSSTELFTGREWQHAMFFRDRWTVNQKLTLDLGLRWEYYPIMSRADRQIEMLDRQTLDVLIGGVGGNPKNMGLVAPKDGFTPRIGAVYRLNDKTVLRSRLRGHARRPRDVGTGSVPRRLQLPARAECELPASRRDVHVRLVWHDRPGHSAPRGTGSEQRPHPAAELLRHADRRAGVDAPRPHAFVERRVRAAPAAERVGRCSPTSATGWSAACRRPKVRRSTSTTCSTSAAATPIARISRRTGVSSTSRSTRRGGGRRTTRCRWA